MSVHKARGHLLEISRGYLNCRQHAPITVYSMAYRIMPINDVWSRRLNDAKFGSPQQMAAAIAVFPFLVELSYDRPSGTAVAAGLIAHNETELDPDCMVSKIGADISGRIGVPWTPGLLNKRPHKSLKLMHGADERDSEVEDTYTSDSLGFPDDEDVTVYLVDDFCTRGATIAEATRAILAANPRLNISIVGFVLGKNENRRFWRQIDNSHLTDSHNTLWTAAGGE